MLPTSTVCYSDRNMEHTVVLAELGLFRYILHRTACCTISSVLILTIILTIISTRPSHHPHVPLTLFFQSPYRFLPPSPPLRPRFASPSPYGRPLCLTTPPSLPTLPHYLPSTYLAHSPPSPHPPVFLRVVTRKKKEETTRTACQIRAHPALHPPAPARVSSRL